MAVFTHLSAQQIAQLAAQYGLGPVRSAHGIAEGVENTNYLLETGPAEGAARHILTVFEKRVDMADLPFYLGLMQHLAARGVACPVPLTDTQGRLSVPVAGGKQAAVVTFLHGRPADTITPAQCGALGRAMAGLHEAGADFSLRRANDLSLAGWQRLHDALGGGLEHIAPGLADELAAELAFLHTHWPRELPRGIIHGDLFPDNVFFQGDSLSGIIDFYFACEDALAYELAICLNCWCFDAHGAFQPERAAALIAGYVAQRPLSEAERRALPVLARGAALRFLLTRAHDVIFHDDEALLSPHDPREYLDKLRFHQGVANPEAYGL